MTTKVFTVLSLVVAAFILGCVTASDSEAVSYVYPMGKDQKSVDLMMEGKWLLEL